MTLQNSMIGLDLSLAALEDAVCALLVTLVEDRPGGDSPALVDRLEHVAAELRGAIAESRQLLPAPALQSASAIRDANRLVNELSTRYWNELAAYAAARAAMQIGDELGRSWRGWCSAVLTSIESCASPLGRVQDALLDCWSELADRRAPVVPMRPVPVANPV